MHTLKIILAGFILLGVCFVAGRGIGAATSAAMKCFLCFGLSGHLSTCGSASAAQVIRSGMRLRLLSLFLRSRRSLRF